MVPESLGQVKMKANSEGCSNTMQIKTDNSNSAARTKAGWAEQKWRKAHKGWYVKLGS